MTAEVPDLDYTQFCNLERYLFTKVSRHYSKTGEISPADFYIILSWKANRAKTKTLKTLTKGKGGFAGSVGRIVKALCKANTPRERLEMLMRGEGLRLPTATAVLTVLYPRHFSVYDVRVSKEVGKKFEGLAHRGFSDGLWKDYGAFLEAVRHKGPKGRSLRDKDRYLWGRSYYKGLLADLAA